MASSVNSVMKTLNVARDVDADIRRVAQQHGWTQSSYLTRALLRQLKQDLPEKAELYAARLRAMESDARRRPALAGVTSGK